MYRAWHVSPPAKSKPGQSTYDCSGQDLRPKKNATFSCPTTDLETGVCVGVLLLLHEFLKLRSQLAFSPHLPETSPVLDLLIDDACHRDEIILASWAKASVCIHPLADCVFQLQVHQLSGTPHSGCFHLLVSWISIVYPKDHRVAYCLGRGLLLIPKALTLYTLWRMEIEVMKPFTWLH